MSKAVEWFRTRAQKSKEKSSEKNSPSRTSGFVKSERSHSGDWRSESDSNSKSSELGNPLRGRLELHGNSQSESDSNSVSSELENPFRGRLPPNGNPQSRSSDFVRPQRPHYEEWRAQMNPTSKSDDFGWPPPGSQVYNEWQDGPLAGSGKKPEQKAFSIPDWKPHGGLDYGLSDFEKPSLFRRPSEDWPSQVSQSSTSTDRNSSGEYEIRPKQWRSVAKEQGREEVTDNRQSVEWKTRSQPREADNKLSSYNLASLRKADLETFDYVLQNWPKLKSSSSDKRRFEARLASLLDVETEVVVIGEESTTERWSLGIVDEGIKALGRAIMSRAYPKLKKLSFTHCRMLLESPFATLAKAINTSNLPNLEEIVFDCNSYINNQGFFELAKAFKTGGCFIRLSTLILIDNGMQDEGLIALAGEAFRSGNLSNLKKLHIGSHSTEKANHEEFHLDAAREFAKELSSSGHLPHLEDLRFSGCVHWKGVVSVVEALETRTQGIVKSLDLRDSFLELEGMRVLARTLEAPQFSYLLSVELSVTTEEMPILLEAFQLKNLSALQRVVLRNVTLGEKDLLGLADVLEARHLPGLLEFTADCFKKTRASALAVVKAYERNNCLVAKLNIDLWPVAELQVEYEKHRASNMELDELI